MIAASTSQRAAHSRLGGVLLRTQPDGRLAQLASEGSEAAFEEIVRRYRAKNQAPKDQDRDGVKNLAEYREGTSPRQADTEGDGTTDGTDQDPCDHGTGDTGTTTTTDPTHP